MCIDVQGNSRGRMPQLTLDVFDIFPLFNQDACIGVSEIVKTDSLNTGSFQGGVKVIPCQMGRLYGIITLTRENKVEVGGRTG